MKLGLILKSGALCWHLFHQPLAMLHLCNWHMVVKQNKQQQAAGFLLSSGVSNIS